MLSQDFVNKTLKVKAAYRPIPMLKTSLKQKRIYNQSTIEQENLILNSDLQIDTTLATP